MVTLFLPREMLIRVFWDGCAASLCIVKVVAIPTVEEGDSRRPSLERESLVGERTKI